MTVPALKKLLRERGLPVSGKKADLVQRLEEGDSGASAKPAAKAAPAKAAEKKQEEPKEDSDDDDNEPPGPTPPYGSKMPDPHKGKPEIIIDEEGRKRWLCLDGQYRRGDPGAIKCSPENFSNWLSEWVVAARTGQCEGKPQMTFLPSEPDNPGNPQGDATEAGRVIKSEDVLAKSEGPDGEPVWEICTWGISLPEEEEEEKKKKAAA